jgi:hypothetical protein
MVSLVDIGPSKGSVEVRGQEIDLNGLTAVHIVGIMTAFPEVRKLLAEKEVDLGVLISQFPIAVAMIIAAGTGKDGDQDTIDVAMALSVGEQYEILSKLMGLTFPKGVKSFLDGVNAALRSAGVRGWDQAMKSPVQFSPASEPDAQKPTAGTQPPDSSAPGASSLPETPSPETTQNSA